MFNPVCSYWVFNLCDSGAATDYTLRCIANSVGQTRAAPVAVSSAARKPADVHLYASSCQSRTAMSIARTPAQLMGAVCVHAFLLQGIAAVARVAVIPTVDSLSLGLLEKGGPREFSVSGLAIATCCHHQSSHRTSFVPGVRVMSCSFSLNSSDPLVGACVAVGLRCFVVLCVYVRLSS